MKVYAFSLSRERMQAASDYEREVRNTVHFLSHLIALLGCQFISLSSCLCGLRKIQRNYVSLAFLLDSNYPIKMRTSSFVVNLLCMTLIKFYMLINRRFSLKLENMYVTRYYENFIFNFYISY